MPRVLPLAQDPFHLEQEVLRLPQLYVGELSVCVDVCVGHAHVRGTSVRTRNSVECKNCDLRYVVLEQTVEHAFLLAARVRVLGNRDGVELHCVQLPLGRRQLFAPPEKSAAVHLAVLPHKFARLSLVRAGVPHRLHLWFKPLLEMVRLHLLQTVHVRRERLNVPQEVAPAVGPREAPARAVRVGVGQGVELGQHVIGDH
mmetsp:Transcript_33369/g.83192  ORF Transcript_33369/g.83192 Transcript_33369/m.83192 type:complete len:200 (+) Transcript_33369:524-1123(+)